MWINQSGQTQVIPLSQMIDCNVKQAKGTHTVVFSGCQPKRTMKYLSTFTQCTETALKWDGLQT